MYKMDKSKKTKIRTTSVASLLATFPATFSQLQSPGASLVFRQCLAKSLRYDWFYAGNNFLVWDSLYAKLHTPTEQHGVVKKTRKQRWNIYRKNGTGACLLTPNSANHLDHKSKESMLQANNLRLWLYKKKTVENKIVTCI